MKDHMDALDIPDGNDSVAPYSAVSPVDAMMIPDDVDPATPEDVDPWRSSRSQAPIIR